MSITANHFDHLLHFPMHHSALDAFSWEPSVRHRTQIKRCSKPLEQFRDIDFICPTIVFSNGHNFQFTCNHPQLAAVYSSSALKSIDQYFTTAIQQKKDYFIPKNDYNPKNSLQNNIVDILESKFHMHNCYGLIRESDDFTIVIGVGNHKPIDNLSKLYQQTYREIETIVINYFDQLMPAYVEENPMLKTSRFTTDANFRKKVIRNQYTQEKFTTQTISPREQEILYWTSKGKSSAEIATFLNISTYTVTEHKKSIMQKLNASNMANAVYKGVKHKLIL